MQKVRRITALIGAIALAALYVSTLILAVIGGENTMNLLLAAVVSTVILPVLLWAYSFIYRLLKRDYSEEARAEEEKMKAAYFKAQEMSGSGGSDESGEPDESEKADDAPRV